MLPPCDTGHERWIRVATATPRRNIQGNTPSSGTTAYAMTPVRKIIVNANIPIINSETLKNS